MGFSLFPNAKLLPSELKQMFGCLFKPVLQKIASGEDTSSTRVSSPVPFTSVASKAA